MTLRRASLGVLIATMGACTLAAGLDALEFAPEETTGGGGGVGGGAGGGGRASEGGSGAQPLSFTDDELDGEFGEGTFEGTAFADERVALQTGQPSGSFVSRVFDAETDVTWQTIGWSPDAPYHKPLPNDGDSETAYLEGGADMSGNIVLLHLDGTDPAPHGALLTESSGRGHNPTVWHANMGEMSYVPGVFGEAIASTLDDHLYIDVPSQSDFDFGTGDFTWGLWAKTTQDCGGAKTWMGIENGTGVHLWLGCYDETASCCGSAVGSYAGGYLTTGPNDDTCYCGTGIISDDTWHHVVMVKAGHTDAEIRLFVDGVRESTTSMSFDASIAFDGTVFTIGAFDFFPPDVPAHISFGHFDETAVFTRALSDAEVSAWYRRAKLRLRFQVRVCADPSCADDPPYLGPDGTEGSFYTDRGAAPPEVTLGELPRGRYFQYRAELETLVAGDTPAFRSVTVTAAP
jgi:hypothetical protein